MSDFIVGLFSNAGNLLIVIVIYIAALWLMFCLWVLIDANKRYHNFLIAILFTLIVFVFNFPALIFYLILRPEEEGGYLASDPAGGVNVPLMNFLGEDGQVKMSLNLTVANQSTQPNSASDMDIQVRWQGDKANFSAVEKAEGSSNVFSSEQKASLLQNRLSSFRQRAQDKLQKAVDTSKKRVEEYSRTLEEQEIGEHSQKEDKEADTKSESKSRSAKRK